MRGDQEIVVVVRRGLELLMMRRAPERLGYWSLVAGGLEPDETPQEAAQRELLEETGLRAEVVHLPLALSYSLLDDPPAIRARYGPGIERVTVHAFVAEAPEGWELVLDAEHWRWTAGATRPMLSPGSTTRSRARPCGSSPSDWGWPRESRRGTRRRSSRLAPAPLGHVRGLVSALPRARWGSISSS